MWAVVGRREVGEARGCSRVHTPALMIMRCAGERSTCPSPLPQPVYCILCQVTPTLHCLVQERVLLAEAPRPQLAGGLRLWQAHAGAAGGPLHSHGCSMTALPRCSVTALPRCSMLAAAAVVL